MADILGLIGFISELVIAFAGFAVAYFTLRKDSKSIPHRLLALATSLIGLYGISIFIYDVSVFTNDAILIGNLVKFFLRFGTIALFFGVVFLYFTFQVIVHTKTWLDQKLNTFPYIIGVLIYSIIFFAWGDAVIVVATTPVVNSQISLGMIATLGICVLLLLLVTMFNLYRFGIKPSEGEKRKKMMIAFIGFFICLAALFVNIASNLVEDALGSIFDILFFLILAGGMSVIAYGFVGPTRK